MCVCWEGGHSQHPQVAFPNYTEGTFSDYEFPSDGAEQGAFWANCEAECSVSREGARWVRGRGKEGGRVGTG